MQNRVFLCHHGTAWLRNYPKYFKPVYYKRYVDDIFALFEKPEQDSRFVITWTKNTKILNFYLKLKNSFSFLNVRIFREKYKFATRVFRKDKFSGVYTIFISFVALEHKFGLVYTLLHRRFTTAPDFQNFVLKLKHLRKPFKKYLSHKVCWHVFSKIC